MRYELGDPCQQRTRMVPAPRRDSGAGGIPACPDFRAGSGPDGYVQRSCPGGDRGAGQPGQSPGPRLRRHRRTADCGHRYRQSQHRGLHRDRRGDLCRQLRLCGIRRTGRAADADAHHPADHHHPDRPRRRDYDRQHLHPGPCPDIVQVPSPGNSPPRYEIASNSGIFTFRVGARLNVGTNQAPGVYNGNFVVTVQYQ